MRSTLSLMSILLLAANLACSPVRETASDDIFTNPVAARSADPWVVRHDETYYYTYTTGRDVTVCQASTLTNVASDCQTVWTPPEGTMYSRQIWAPELHFVRGNWYVYVAASDGQNENHRMYVLEADSPDPQGRYTFKGKITAPSDRWAIDGTVLDHEGELYFIWSGWEGFEDGRQDLYAAKMSNPWTISGTRSRIARPVHDWEKNGLPINEGPQILRQGNNLFIVYSASGYWTPEYSLGLLEFTGGEVTDSSSWRKAAEPVFSGRGTGVQGTGHASFTTSCDGSQHWIVYHAHRPGDAPRRDLRMQPFTFGANGRPDFEPPVPPGAALPVPSGC